MIEIPLTSSPEQLFNVVLNGNKYDVRVILNSRTGTWTMSLSRGGVDIVNGIALLAGVDIFEQYNLRLGNAYIVNLENSRLDPSKSGLGTSSRLFILEEGEV